MIAVIFTSARTDEDQEGYDATSALLDDLVTRQPGFAGVESAHDAVGLGITVSYWETVEDAHAWSRVAEHAAAQRLGRERWYRWYRLRICTVDDLRVWP